MTRDDHVDPRIGMFIGFVAATLAVGSFVHLAGYTPGGTKPPFDATGAGIAEAIISVVLAYGAVAILRATTGARAAAVVTISFAILGFFVGLSMTARGGDVADVVYHVITLPALIVSLILVVRRGRKVVVTQRGSQ
jgi:hypothetical protein